VARELAGKHFHVLESANTRRAYTGGMVSSLIILSTGVDTLTGETVLMLPNAKPRRPSSGPVAKAGASLLAHSIAWPVILRPPTVSVSYDIQSMRWREVPCKRLQRQKSHLRTESSKWREPLFQSISSRLGIWSGHKHGARPWGPFGSLQMTKLPSVQSWR